MIIERAASEDGPYLLGNQLSVADVFLFAAISCGGAQACLPPMDLITGDRPKIKRAIESVGALENVRGIYAGLKEEQQKLPTVGDNTMPTITVPLHALCGV